MDDDIRILCSFITRNESLASPVMLVSPVGPLWIDY